MKHSQNNFTYYSGQLLLMTCAHVCHHPHTHWLTLQCSGRTTFVGMDRLLQSPTLNHKASIRSSQNLWLLKNYQNTCIPTSQQVDIHSSIDKCSCELFEIKSIFRTVLIHSHGGCQMDARTTTMYKLQCHYGHYDQGKLTLWIRQFTCVLKYRKQNGRSEKKRAICHDTSSA